MITIASRSSAKDTLLNFTPALTNLWDIVLDIDNNKAGLDGNTLSLLNNFKYLITAIEIEGWSFKYDYIPAYQKNILVGVNRPTRIIASFTDTRNLGILDAFITLINVHLFKKTNSTLRNGSLGKVLGNLEIRIFDPFATSFSNLYSYSPFLENPTDYDKYTSFLISCTNIRVSNTPSLILSRTEAKPIQYSIDFVCDTIRYASHLEKKNLIIEAKNNEIEEKSETKEESAFDSGSSDASNNIPKSFSKFLEVNVPVFSNLFHVNFDFGPSAGMPELTKKLWGKDNIFNDIMIESATIEGYAIDYTFSEALLRNMYTKIRRPMIITFSIIDNNKLVFLSTLYELIRNYYYKDTGGYFISTKSGKNMTATFYLYKDKSKEFQYLIRATGMKISKISSLSLNYTNSDAIKYTVDMVCDNITFYNQKESKSYIGAAV